MQSRGFSLIELLTIVGILSILYAIGTLSFNSYQKRYRTEAQTRFLFSEIQKARADAICQRRGTRIKVYRDRFERYSTYQDDTSGVQPLQTNPLTFPVVWEATSANGDRYIIDFESRGIIDTDASSGGSICIDDNSASGAVDSIKIYSTRISIGKKGQGNDCSSANITVK
uniref:Prepilin-type N-terminal cleavage/methylation domain-containing protein n=1 Tax=Geobacter sp. (strain M21) TaxID=443144 RepID=C6E0T6_GEOSM